MWMWLRLETTIYLLMLENHHNCSDELVARLLKNSGWKWSRQQPQLHAIPLILMVFCWCATVTTHLFLSELLDGILLELCTQRSVCHALSKDDSTSCWFWGLSFCSKTAYSMLPYTAEQEVIVSWKKKKWKKESSKATGRETLSGAGGETAFYAEPGRPQEYY